MENNNEKQNYTSLNIEVVEIQLEKGYAATSSHGGEDAGSEDIW